MLLSGLPVFSRLRTRNPGKALCVAPGRKTAECCRVFPEAMLRICPGYPSSAVCEPVARAGALRRPREEDGAVLLYQNQISVCTPKFQLPPAVKPLLPKSSLIA